MAVAGAEITVKVGARAGAEKKYFGSATLNLTLNPDPEDP